MSEFNNMVREGVDAVREHGFNVGAPALPGSDGDLEVAAAIMMAKEVKRRWANSVDLFWPSAETCETLPPGFYNFDNQPNIGPCLRKAEVKTDGLLELPDTVASSVVKEFKTFWGLRDKFVERGFLHKRGILLHGPAGSGKTVSLMLMSREIIDQHKGIVVQINHPALAANCLAFIRKIEPERPIVALMEDIDSLIAEHGENQFLALLDGETQVDRIVYIATCNYPERLDKRFKDRPSRFDTVAYVGMPTAAARRMFFRLKEPSMSEAELSEWVECTEGFSIAHLRELIISCKCFGYPLLQTIERLESMRESPPDSERSPDRQPVGIVPASRSRRGGGGGSNYASPQEVAPQSPFPDPFQFP